MVKNKATVLVVDDDAITCILLQAALESAGYKVLIANDGEAAIRSVENCDPDLLLLDIMLPDISGIEVYKKIKNIDGCVAPPVIFITSLAEDAILHQCHDMDGVDYILKPLRTDVLLARVANTLELVESRKKLARKNEELASEVMERNRLAAIIEQFRDSVFIVERNGDISYANQACEENSGYSPAELIGESIWKTQRVETDKKILAEMLKCVRGGDEWQGAINNVKKDGSLCLQEVLVRPIRDVDGAVSSHVVIKKDITERRRLESIASSVNLMSNVGFVFSGIRHELGNPVNSLKMTLSVLSKKIEHFSTEKIVEFLQRSQNEISRIEYLLKSLRSFSMFEKPVLATVHLQGFMQNIMDIHRKEFDAAQISVRVQVNEDAAMVCADSRALMQVLLNLLANAAYAVEGRVKPSITITASRKSDLLICLAIADNGCGISARNQEMLFKPFYTTRGEGTGLGLVIVQKMLAEMDCSIQVESKEFEGATFSILLPEGSA